ncbi:mitochondrial inner membrane protease subunit 2 [Culicoides brevitarsis]|uniref:mitochondrial inner membrane protease subunit 2 n=1 Tax=Culicoides brevitarsis TaxID=469753 RepID=UPI00307B4682
MFRMLKYVVIGISVPTSFMDCFASVARVDGTSMQPCLNSQNSSTPDYVLLSRTAVRNLEFNRGDVVSVISPKDPNQRIIKRIVGLEGDLIPTLGYNLKHVKVPEGHVWIEGDNSQNSLDSNNFGPVSVGLITGKAVYILWPPQRYQKLDSKLPKTRLQSLLAKPLSVRE